MGHPIYALNLFRFADKEEFLVYAGLPTKEMQKNGGRVIPLGKHRETVVSDMQLRTVMILVEWN